MAKISGGKVAVVIDTLSTLGFILKADLPRALKLERFGAALSVLSHRIREGAPTALIRFVGESSKNGGSNKTGEYEKRTRGKPVSKDALFIMHTHRV